MTKTYKCPSCDAPLREAVTNNGRALWCCNIACESLAAEDPGGIGRNSKLAFDDLCLRIKKERDNDIKDMGRAGC